MPPGGYGSKGDLHGAGMNDYLLLDRFTIVPLAPEISTSAVNLLKTYRLSHGLLIADALIAATALVMDRVLVSGNSKHFSMIKGLQFRSA